MVRHTGSYFAKLALIFLAGLGGIAQETAVELWRRGHALRVEGELRLAEQWFRQALGAPSIDSITAAMTTSELGAVLVELGRTKEAGEHLRTACPALERELGTTSVHTASCQFQLAIFYRRVGEHEKSEALLIQAKPHLETALAKDPIQQAAFDTALAVVYYQTNRCAEALNLLQRGKTNRERRLPKDHWRMGLTYAELGHTYQCLGRYEEGAIAMQRAVDILERNSRPGDLANALIALGQVKYLVREFRSAEDCWKRALTITEPRSDLTDSRVAVRSRLALLYIHTKKGNEAEPLLREALAILDQAPALASRRSEIFNGLGSLYLIRKDLRRAEEAFEQALLTAGEREAAATDILRNRARTRLAGQRCPEALADFQSALDKDLKLQGEGHPLIPDHMFEIAGAMKTCGQKSQAKAVRARAQGLAAASAFKTHTVDYRDLERKR